MKDLKDAPTRALEAALVKFLQMRALQRALVPKRVN